MLYYIHDSLPSQWISNQAEGQVYGVLHLKFFDIQSQDS
jgi:hypothetical protein